MENCLTRMQVLRGALTTKLLRKTPIVIAGDFNTIKSEVVSISASFTMEYGRISEKNARSPVELMTNCPPLVVLRNRSAYFC